MTWKKGETGNMKGRPRSGTSLAEVIRRKVDPEKMVEELEKIATESPSEQTRMRAIELLMERGWKKPAQVLEVGPANEFEDLTNEEIAALRAQAQAALVAAEGRLLNAGETAAELVMTEREQDVSGALVEGAARPSLGGTSPIAVTTLRPGVLRRGGSAGDDNTGT